MRWAVDPERGREGDSFRMFGQFLHRRGNTAARKSHLHGARVGVTMHHMVRNLVGTFILIGEGTLQVQDMTRILEARNRSAAGATAPARGLYLVEVEY